MNNMIFPAFITEALTRVHPSWQPILLKGLAAMQKVDPDYFIDLEKNEFLPTQGRIFAAFSQPFESVRFILVGEGPYPRAESASGYCFMDAAVKEIWSDKGLAKPVNRATSLRNFIKMLLVADGKLTADKTGSDAMEMMSHLALNKDSSYIQSLDEMQETMINQGFLLLNAALVYRLHMPAAKETKAWQPFLYAVLDALAKRDVKRDAAPVLILWGKLAEKLVSMPFAAALKYVVSEHPYNLSFIHNKDMQILFRPLHLMYKKGC